MRSMPKLQQKSSCECYTHIDYKLNSHTTMACKKTKSAPAMDFPGLAIDKADDERTTVNEEKQRTASLNDNPRNNGEIV